MSARDGDESSDPRLELPFDQYQRYRIAADLFERLDLRPPARILEVGGAPGPLEDFLPGFDPIVTDLSGERGGRFALADGAALPFADESFAAVVALDVLEHVPGDRRSALLADLRRASSDVVVLSAPFADAQLVLAEEALNEFIRARFGGDFPTLDEHGEHGHPELEATVASFRDAGWQVAVLPSGYLPRWLAGMLVHHELLATGLPVLGKLHAYYNEVVSPLDHREPAYRHVVLASRRRGSAELGQAVDALRSDGDDAVGAAHLAALAAAVLRLRVGDVFSSYESLNLRDELEDLRRQLVDREAHLAEERRRAEELAAMVRAARDARLLGLAGVLRRLRDRSRGGGSP